MKERMNMKTRNFILSLILLLGVSLNVLAQSSAVKKVADAAFTLTTFKSDGSILATSNGVCISTDGVAVSPWKPFIGADKAVIIDAKGQKHDVTCLLGANEIYDIVKFCVSGKVNAATLTNTVSTSEDAWIVPMAKSGTPEKANVSSVEKFMDKYNYSILSPSASDKLNGAPVVNTKGQVIGLFNASGSNKSAVDVNYAKDFMLTGLSQNDATMNQSNLRIGLPSKLEDALVALMLSSEKSASIHEATINDFISRFPQVADGYNAQANVLIGKSNFTEADKVLQTAQQKYEGKNSYSFRH